MFYKHKFILIAFLFFTKITLAQDCINFDVRFIDCLNRWVILPQNQNEDLPFTYGYVFLNEESQIVFQTEGTFEVGEECNFYPIKAEKTVRIKINPSNILISMVTDDKFLELDISEMPDFAKNIKAQKETAKTYFDLGFLYNEWGESDKALNALNQAAQLNPKMVDLDREMAFAYNSLKRYEEALEILQQLREKYPKDAYIYRELIFALVKSGKLKEATYNLKHSLAVCNEKKYNGENCLNVLYMAFVTKDTKIFSQWIKKAKYWNKGNSKALDLIKNMEKEMEEEDF